MGVLSPPISGTPYLSNSPVLPAMEIGSVWRRIGAAIIDFLIVGTLVNVIAIPFFDPLSKLGG